MTYCKNCGGKLPRNTKYETCLKCRGLIKLQADQAIIMAAMRQAGLAATQRRITAMTGLDVCRVNKVMKSLTETGLAAPRAGGAKYLLTEKAMEEADGKNS